MESILKSYIEEINSKHKLKIDHEDIIDSLNSQINEVKEVIGENVGLKNINLCVNFSNNIVILNEINFHLINQLLRKIIRKENTQSSMYFNPLIDTLNISIVHKCESINVLSFFFFYLINYLKIKHVIYNPCYNDELILYYIMKNDLLESIQVKIFFPIENINIFDIIKMKPKIKKLSIYVTQLKVDVMFLNKILSNLINLEELEFKEVEEFYCVNEQVFENFIEILKMLKFLNSFSITSNSKFLPKKFNSSILKNYQLNCLFKLFSEKDFKYFEICDINNKIKEEDFQINLSYNFFNKKNKTHLVLIMNLENFNFFNFINFDNLKIVNLGPVDNITFQSLIKKLKNIKLLGLNVKLQNNFYLNDEIFLNCFSLLNDKEYNIKNIEIYNAHFEIKYYNSILNNLLVKNTYIEKLIISPLFEFYIDDKLLCLSNLEKNYFYYKFDKNLLFTITFCLKKKKLTLNKNIIQTIGLMTKNLYLKTIYIESDKEILISV